MNRIAQNIASTLFNECKADKNSRTILALSGGIDSVVLCYIFKELNINFAVAHCNFQLRGEDANGDKVFVETLANKFNVPFYTVTFETDAYAKQNKFSIQMAARELRYTWLEEIRKTNQYHFIATAHHANDQAETIFMNLIKGTGLKGLQGMAYKNNYLIRPMLKVTKQEVLLYAKSRKIDFREDVSNTCDKYTRNKIRLNMLPIAEQVNPNFHNEITAFSEKINDAKTIYNTGLNLIIKKLEKQIGADTYLSVLQLQKQAASKTVLFEILQRYNFTPAQTTDVFDLLNKDAGKVVLSTTHRILKDRKHLIITPLNEIDLSTTHLITSQRERLTIKDFALDINVKNAEKYKPEYRPKVAIFDAEKVVYPLMVRKWKDGDYFYPFGLTKRNSDKIGKKKLKKFYADIKLSVRDKERIWVVQDANNRIIWVVGLRTDARFSITNETKKILRMKLTHVAKDYPLIENKL